jgi:hypothetical protein
MKGDTLVGRLPIVVAVLVLHPLVVPGAHLAASSGPPTRLVTVHEAVAGCRLPNSSLPAIPLVLHGYYVADSPSQQHPVARQGSKQTGYMFERKVSLPIAAGAKQQAVLVHGTSLGKRSIPNQTWVDIYGRLECPTKHNPILTAMSWKAASSRVPVLQVYVSVRAPQLLRLDRTAVFRVSVRFAEPIPLGAADADFRLSSGWSTPAVRTPDGSQACGGDNGPLQPVLSRGYWDLNFGDCSTIDLELTPTTLGLHSLTIRVFRVPLDDRGMPMLAKRVEESSHRYQWQGMVRSS